MQDTSARQEAKESYLSWGWNFNYQCARFNTTENSFVAQEVESFAGLDIENIVCGWFHGAALLRDGTMFTFGNNCFGQLGIGPNQRFLQHKPFHLRFKSFKVKQVAVGMMHTLILSDTNQVLAFGSNNFGQLSFGFLVDCIPTPVPIQSLKDVLQVYCGANHSLALTADNELYSWGDHVYGQLGIGKKQAGPVEKVDTAALALPRPETCFAEVCKIHFFSGRSIAMIACANCCDHNLVWTTDRRLYAFGNNSCGALGLGDFENRSVPTELVMFRDRDVSHIGVGTTHSIVMLADSNIYVWGGNSLGQIGNGDIGKETVPIPMLVTTLQSYRITSVQCGACHNIAIAEEGVVLSWGNNVYGQLGLNGFMDRSVPEEIKFLKYKDIRSLWVTSYENFALIEHGYKQIMYRSLLRRHQAFVDLSIITYDFHVNSPRCPPFTTALLSMKFVAAICSEEPVCKKRRITT